MPSPSCQRILIRSPLAPRNTKRSPACGSRPSASCTCRPDRSCRAACRSGRPRATPARPREPGSSPLERVQHPLQRGRADRAADPHTIAIRHLDLDRVVIRRTSRRIRLLRPHHHRHKLRRRGRSRGEASAPCERPGWRSRRIAAPPTRPMRPARSPPPRSPASAPPARIDTGAADANLCPSIRSWTPLNPAPQPAPSSTDHNRRTRRFTPEGYGSPAHIEPDRERVRYRQAPHCEDQGRAVARYRPPDGIQTRHGGGEDLAAVEGREPVAESHCRRHIPKRRRGHQHAKAERRLISPSPSFGYSSIRPPSAHTSLGARP